MNEKTLAIILVNYNGLEYSIDCINSIKASSTEAKYTIVLVDNASAIDETIDIRNHFPDVVTFRSEVNGGFSYGNNIGIKWALDQNYDYVMLLNNDTVIDTNMIGTMLKHVDNHTVLSPKILFYDSKDMIWYGGASVDKRTGNVNTWEYGKKDRRDTEPKYCNFASGCCMLIPSNVLNDTGLLNEDFFMYCEDTDFCIRLQKKGYRIKYIPTAKVYHKVSATSGGNDSDFCVYYQTRNRVEVIKEYPEYFSFTAMPFTIISRHIRMIQMKRKGNSSWAYFKIGIEDGLSEIKGKVDLMKVKNK